MVTFPTPLVSDETEAELWVPTANLPKTHPYGITSSLDGLTLYVNCVGNGADGVVVAIDTTTKTQTTIASTLQYAKSGMDIDSAGNLYFVTGPNDTTAPVSTLWKWDGSSSSAQWTDTGLFGMCIGENGDVYYEYKPDHISRFRRRTMAGDLVNEVFADDTETTSQFDQWRGMDTTADYFVSGDANTSGLVVRGLDLAFDYRQDLLVDSPLGVAAVSSTEVYLLGNRGTLRRFDPAANTRTTLTVTGLPADTGVSPQSYGMLHITRRGEMYATRGSWTADASSIRSTDWDPGGTDAGIYKIETNAVGGWRLWVSE